jgi:membrane-associated phospholipid phosphatase
VYPEGQLSLFLDQSETLNPETAIGRTYTEILQLFYVSYYLWGAVPFFYILYKYTFSHNWRSLDRNKAQNSPNTLETALSARYLAEMKLYLCGWMSAFFMTFLMNRAFPAKSPRLYLESQFEHQLEGWGLASSLIGIATDDTSYGSFPSGHFNETLVCAFFAYRISRTLGIIVFIAAAGIALATQALRYHYFIDVAAGLLVAALAIAYGFNWSRDSYNGKIEAALVDYEERQGLAAASFAKKDKLEKEGEVDCGDCCAVQLDEIQPQEGDREILLEVPLETISDPLDSANIVLRNV